MNDPKHDDLERRVKKLEVDRDDIVESEKLLLRLSKHHRAALQELKANFEVEMGDVRERFDGIERTLEDHTKRFDSIEQTQSAHTEVLGQILQLLQAKKE
ncbi:MAG TPA: hypothetical protein VN207_09660 [Ktedonobacteraceae bacterium]|nr:hypothetical protein [Ktedonobacteraceae bacterium]